MKAEEYITSNYRSKFNPLLDKHNREIPQYTFDDLADMAEAYAQHQLAEKDKRIKELEEALVYVVGSYWEDDPADLNMEVKVLDMYQKLNKRS